MKRASVTLLLLLLIAPILYGAYPREYPIYLGLMGFTKNEIVGLQDGRLISHSIKNKLPGEYGATVAVVSNVPVYYFRDYFGYVENFRSIIDFQQVGKFSDTPKFQDLKALQFDDRELEEFLQCKERNCGIKLSADEIAAIPEGIDLQTGSDRDRERISDAYRQIFLERLLRYQREGTAGLPGYADGPHDYNLQEILSDHILKFPHVDAYFPLVKRYILEYPRYRNKRINEFFFWSKEEMGNKPLVAIRHVFSQRIGEDTIIVTKLVYSNHYLLSSLAFAHLLNYVDNGTPRTLIVLQQRSLTDLRDSPWEWFGRSIMRSNLERRVASEYKAIIELLEERYKGRTYVSFPYELHPRDQR